MRRFRPNIVTTGSAPFAEDAWQQLTIADVDFEGVKPCSRCKVRLAVTLLYVNCRGMSTVSPRQPVCIQLTTVDQTTAVVGKEPLETLHTFRTGAGLGWAEAAGGQHVHVHITQLLQSTPGPDAMDKLGQVVSSLVFKSSWSCT